FKDLAIKGRSVKGNIVTKLPIKRVELKEEGVSTLKPRKIWFDDTVRRLNTDERGELLGAFKGNDRLLIVRQNGIVKTIIPEITTHFENDVIVLEKWQPKKPISVIYWEGEKQRYYLKRFLIEQADKEEQVITDHPDSQLELISTDYRPQIEIEFIKQKGKDRKPNQIINAEEFIAIKGIKAQGNQLTADKVKQINALEPLKHELDDIESKNVNDESENNSSNESQASLF
ncbi:MAG: DNA gyrase/topoisomerase IV subunit A, partial [Psychroflexus salarius]